MKSDILHGLIKAMDKCEITAFHSSMHMTSPKWGAQRALLFDTLLNSGSYDAKKLNDALTDPDFRNKLSMEKDRMYEAILTSVFVHRSIREIGKDPWQMLRQSVLLIDMGLTTEASQKAIDGIKVAEKVDDLFAELQLREHLRICYKLLPRAKNLQAITENEYRLQLVVSKVANLTRYSLVCDKLVDHQKKYRVADDRAVRTVMVELMAEEQMSDLALAMSLPAQIRFATAHAFYAESIGSLKEAEDHWNLCLSLWESSPKHMAYRPHLYRQALSNLIGVHICSGQTDQVPMLLKRMEQVPVSSRRASMLGFCDVELQYQLFYLNTGRFEEALQREQTVQSGIRSFGKLMVESKELTLLYNFGITHLILGNDHRAKAYFSIIRNKGALQSRLDLQGLAQLFRLLLLLESDHDDQFRYFLRSYTRTFRKEMPFYRMEELLHQWMTKHYRQFHSAEGPALLLQLHGALEEFETQRLIGAEELRLWTLSRATGKSMKEVMAEKTADQG